jgi:hypothetical protein
MAHTETGLSTNTYPCNIQPDTTKPEGVFYRVADTEKLSLMHQPTTPLEEGIRRVAVHLTAAKS